MTKSAKEKKEIRAFAAAHGLSYTAAKRAVESITEDRDKKK